eukprot:gb/GECG01007894.1/.p1 GENE.gb/GECG01007894.1/~~gb/GECG01007894.1/.p1  ORF type:complete len:217 (+),score=19.92 gb/GECG01007894.1/:1-651(+)
MSSEKYMNVPSSDDAMEMGEQQSKKSSMGSIAGSDNDTLRTLDEPVTRTIMRDLKMIATKLRYVLMPRGGTEETLKSLRDWDLWGPLLLCLTLSIVMSIHAAEGQTSLVFAAVFVIVWVGAGVVTLNAQLLGGRISFFQSVCVLGYCIFPLVLASLVTPFIPIIFLKMLIVLGTYLWCTRASVVFMASMVQESRRFLAIYPVCLFYLIISWMIYIQ